MGEERMTRGVSASHIEADHLARYRWACRFSEGRAVLDVGLRHRLRPEHAHGKRPLGGGSGQVRPEPSQRRGMRPPGIPASGEVRTHHLLRAHRAHRGRPGSAATHARLAGARRDPAHLHPQPPGDRPRRGGQQSLPRGRVDPGAIHRHAGKKPAGVSRNSWASAGNSFPASSWCARSTRPCANPGRTPRRMCNLRWAAGAGPST